MGYVLHPLYWNCGYGTEALNAILSYGFSNLDLRRIEARYRIENKASLSIMKKVGMQEEGILRKSLYVKGKYRDIGICSILKEEYK